MEDRQLFSAETPSPAIRPLILLADDDALSRRLLSDALQRSGFDVQEAADGDEALRLAGSEAPDLLVLDFEMPQLNGAELCQRLRTSEREDLQTLPVIMLTAHTGETAEITCLQAGANDFVTKPISREVLAARVRTQLRLHSMADELRQRNEELGRWRAEHEADLAAAYATQRALVPMQPPKVAGWSVESIYQPAIEIGGDVFGWRPIDKGRWLFWLADATGHGAAAALLTALTAQLFRQAYDTEHEPAAILRTVNWEFRRVFAARAFMTASCVLIDSRGNLTFSGAAHPPLFVRRAKGTVDAFASQGTILGLENEGEIGESRTKLRRGDVAVLYTDGLYAFKQPDGEHFSHEQLRTALGTVAPGEAFFERLLKTVRAGSNGGPCGDDIAAIALQRS